MRWALLRSQCSTRAWKLFRFGITARWWRWRWWWCLLLCLCLCLLLLLLRLLLLFRFRLRFRCCGTGRLPVHRSCRCCSCCHRSTHSLVANYNVVLLILLLLMLCCCDKYFICFLGFDVRMFELVAKTPSDCLLYMNEWKVKDSTRTFACSGVTLLGSLSCI